MEVREEKKARIEELKAKYEEMAENRTKVGERLVKAFPKLSLIHICAIAAAMPDGCCEVVRGTMEGIIGHKIAGENGFGYDPIFFLPECGCTSAELSPEKKNELSHRGEGLKKIRKILEQR